MGIFESTAAIIIGIKEIASSLSLKKSILWFFLILFILFALFYIFEIYTGHFYFTRLNKKVDILTRIDKQIPKDSPIKNEIYNQYELIVKDISKYKVSKRIPLGKIGVIKLTEKSIQNIFKFLTALIIPLIFFIFGTKKESPKGKRDMLVGTIVIGIVSGFIALFIPIVYKPWVNYLGFPIIQFTILMAIGIFIKK